MGILNTTMFLTENKKILCLSHRDNIGLGDLDLKGRNISILCPVMISAGKTGTACELESSIRMVFYSLHTDDFWESLLQDHHLGMKNNPQIL